MATVKLDESDLAAIRSEIGYRLRYELDREVSPLPPRLAQLVRALNDLPATNAPSIALTRTQPSGR